MRRSNVEISEKTSLKNFFRTSSLRSLKYLQENDKGSPHILIWGCVNGLLVMITLLLMVILWEKLNENPTLTTLKTTNYPISEVPFPAVAICNLNKISKRRAVKMADFVSRKTGANLTVAEDYMKVLGSFYDFDYTYGHKILEFQQILEGFPHVEKFQPVKLMRWLAPSCEEYLLNCKWKNERINCSEIFQTRLTHEGYCCIFNYVKETNEIIKENFIGRDIEDGYPGLEFGLTVELNNQFNDYYYTRQASLGANIHTFSPVDYPDKNSGSLNEHLVGSSTEFFMRIDVTSFKSEEAVRKVPLTERGCYFRSERTTSFGAYSESDCLMDCRIESMIGLCDCVPHLIPQNRSLVCGLSDIQCLNKHRIKWESLAPPDAIHNKQFLREAHYSLTCEDRCWPVCEAIIYDMTTNSVRIKNRSHGNNSLLHVYFNSRYATLYEQDVYYYWFEILGKIGAVSTLILGISIVSMLEIILFCSRKLWNYIHNYSFSDEDFCSFCIWSF